MDLEHSKENIQAGKIRIIENGEQSNKRRTCALTDHPQQVFYHFEPAPNQANQLKIGNNEVETIAAEADFDRSLISEAIGTNPTVLQVLEISPAIPETLCTEPLILQDADYKDDFLTHFREREHNFRPRPHYLKQQLEIDHTARAILVNWLVSVTNESKFDTETLYLTVSYVDRFLSQIVLSRNRLQLIGVTAVYVAAKYEETRPPGVNRFAYIGGIKFDTKQIVKMERLLLSTLSYDLHAPTSYAFAVAYTALTSTPHLLKFLTLYICELTLLEADPYLQYLPSQISAASHALARYLLGYSIWSKQLEALTLYRLEDLKQIVMHLCKTHFQATKLLSGATRMKFLEEKYHQVALISPVIVNDLLFDDLVKKYISQK